ncbi:MULTISPECIES: hypothetical protein [unclassified Lentimonas]|uniref:hypothetical protein n=1 Tax=unclassified Lentimonas TaxID=2630993 RepID=UPI00132BE9FD|nr:MULTISPECIES: hypothetical protein [unclassified Lentimonas]CAA6679032.1 Unannotated [Lentimonas sp. CC4]CAA6684228.1 Unannotated [Lentimonas sp. CC6]CAA6693671.1 Unannotated [Lentimonas sp. CC10]CAA6696062.1 Unannotated [Lentimonas sp. CC19]CAA7071697.1 Unannotated [Lentimonas sp. CC11]
MSQTELSTGSRLLSLVGIIGALLVFAVIFFVAYLPSRPTPVDQAVNEARQAKADEARAAGVAKLTSFEVIDAEAGTVRIPIEDAMELTVAAYQNN